MLSSWSHWVALVPFAAHLREPVSHCPPREDQEIRPGHLAPFVLHKVYSTCSTVVSSRSLQPSITSQHFPWCLSPGPWLRGLDCGHHEGRGRKCSVLQALLFSGLSNMLPKNVHVNGSRLTSWPEACEQRWRVVFLVQNIEKRNLRSERLAGPTDFWPWPLLSVLTALCSRLFSPGWCCLLVI